MDVGGVPRQTLKRAARGPLLVLALLGSSPSPAMPRLEATPRQLLSGRDSHSTLFLSGLPADARLACSAGQVFGLHRAAPNSLQASFVPPRTDTIAPLLCAAVSPSSGAHASVVLEVQRQQILPLTDLPPLGRVEVRIGDTVYGPVRADALGQAELSVLLTPGQVQAAVSTTTAGQPPRERKLPLPVSSPRPVVLLLAEDAAVDADGVRGVRVWAFSVNGRGEPLDGPLLFSHPGGTFTSQRVAPGLQMGTFVPLPRSSPGEVLLSAQTPTSEPSRVHLVLRSGVRPLLVLEAASHELMADGTEGTDLTIRVQDENGRALPGQPVRLEASRGEVAPLQDRGDGTYLARYRAPTGGGEARLTAMLEGAAPTSLALVLHPPPRLTLEASTHVLPADGLARLVLHLTARDAHGLLAPEGTQLALSSTLGTLPATVRTHAGQARVEWVSESRAGEALIEARWEEATVHTTVRLLPGAPARLHVKVEGREVLCDGHDSTRIHLFVQDAQGNPLEGVPITLSAAGTQAEHGQFERVAALGGGEFITRFQAPPRCEGGVATVLAAAGEARGDARLSLAPRTPWGLTVRLGAQSNLGPRLQPALELEGDVRPSALGERLAASVSVQVAWGRLSLAGENPPHEPFSLAVQSLTTTLSAGARWLFPLRGPLTAYAGAGLDTHLVSLDWRRSLVEGPQRQVSAVLGGHARLGLSTALGPGELVLQARYGLARLPEDSPFQGPVGGLSASLGYHFPL